MPRLVQVTAIVSCYLFLTYQVRAFDESDELTGDVETFDELDKPASEIDTFKSAQQPEYEYFEEDLTSEPSATLSTSKRSSLLSKISLISALGVSRNFFDARLGLAFALNRYLSTVLEGFYKDRPDSEQEFFSYGPDVSFQGQIPNQTLFSPFVGISAGYEFWRKSSHEVVYDESESTTAGYFFGLDLALTKQFGIKLIRRFKRYLSEPPLANDQVTRTAQNQISSEISFTATF